MKLAGDFFRIIDLTATTTGFTASVQLKPDHLIYTGHFPGQPVTPGVAQMQIVHELLEHFLGKELTLQRILQCKFLKIINPEKTAYLEMYFSLKQEDGILSVNARGEQKQMVYFTLKGSYR